MTEAETNEGGFQQRAENIGMIPRCFLERSVSRHYPLAVLGVNAQVLAHLFIVI